MRWVGGDVSGVLEIGGEGERGEGFESLGGALVAAAVERSRGEVIEGFKEVVVMRVVDEASVIEVRDSEGDGAVVSQEVFSVADAGAGAGADSDVLVCE
ncbi:hypothetical protein EYC84_002447 [Monilinia fructicola]|uniref:Uncharacterized protein n=1 Tax=Monilinia fructicola TaxID=38448 RepID=A0A5M9JT94_MONFR|nr:hypothetical protein EYC84_002447 [Monilinia fructicola]